MTNFFERIGEKLLFFCGTDWQENYCFFERTGERLLVFCGEGSNKHHVRCSQFSNGDEPIKQFDRDGDEPIERFDRDSELIERFDHDGEPIE